MVLFVLTSILPILLLVVTIFLCIKARIAATNEDSKRDKTIAILSAVASLLTLGIIQVPEPIIYPLDSETRTFIDDTKITISDIGCFVKTYYSLDGADPKEGKIYSEPIIISKSTTVCARSKFLWIWSDPVERSYLMNNLNDELRGYIKAYINEKLQSDLEQVRIEENDNTEKFQVQQYPDDYVITWEDETFERLMKDCLNKDQIIYADVKDILAIEIFDDKIILDKGGEEEKLDYDLIYRKTTNNISLNDLKYFDSLVFLSIFNFQSINFDIFEDDNFSNRLRGLYVSVELDSDQIEQISKLDNLQSLFIERNNITTSDLETISTIEGLIELVLWDDNITDISSLSNLKQLMYLDLSRNNITNIDALSDLEILETVLLAGNNIIDYSPVSHVKEVIKTPEEALKYFNTLNKK